MKVALHRITLLGIAALLVAATANLANAQPVTAAESGMPGDGIPDLYYWPESGLVAPNGEVRDAGFLQLDTDGADFSALLVSDADAFFFDGCFLCDGGGILPPLVDPPGQFFTVGNINGSSQWVRTFPLQGPGFLGIIDLAQGPGGLDESYFVPIFDDTAPEGLWSFRYATDSSGQFFSNVTVLVPEPGCMSLLGMGALALLGLIRRR